ncbi:hypothetical protein [Nonomuraea recticatena]|uniref:Uncharacterized protein n=1 Tax=Nonomuraea recticatena TaxID=46178 RepID=A0ABN3SUT3_9ACTN
MKDEQKSRSVFALSAMIVTAAVGVNAMARPAPAETHTATMEATHANPPSPSREDASFLRQLRAAGFTEARISDEQAIDAAHKVVYWVCDDNRPSSRLYVEDYLYKFGIDERRGPRSANAFTEAALLAYRQTSDPTNC